MATRKITRKEMKQDDFVSSVGQATMWVEDHLTTILWAIAGVAALALAIYGFASWRSSRAMAGTAALAEVMDTYEAEVGSAAATAGAAVYADSEEKYRAVIAQADTVLREHGSTPAGEMARYYRGLARFHLGETAEARADLQEFLDRNPRHFLAHLVSRKLGELDESEGNLDGACERYRSLADVKAAEFPRELAILDLAGCLSERGEREEARATFQRVLDEYPDSIYASEARQSLQELEQG